MSIRTRPATPEYLENWERVFRAPAEEPREAPSEEPQIEAEGESSAPDGE